MPHPIVHFLVFYDAPDGAAGEVVPIVVRAVGDARGRLRTDLPVPRTPVSSGPALGLTVDLMDEAGTGRRVVAGIAWPMLVAGQSNALGVIRSPQSVESVRCDARRFGGERGVVCTGVLDPRRWVTKAAGAALATFPRERIGSDGWIQVPLPWDLAEPLLPFVTLVVDGRPAETRRVVVRQPEDGAPARVRDVIFGVRGHGRVEGRVLGEQGAPLAGAVARTVGLDPPLVLAIDEDGWFAADDLPAQVTALDFVHPLYVTRRVRPEDWAIPHIVTLTDRRPRVALRVVDATTKRPVTRVFVRIAAEDVFSETESGVRATEFLDLSSETGHYEFSWEFPLVAVDVEQVGYRPHRITNPAAQMTRLDGLIDVPLTPGVALDVRPRDYSRIQWRRGWMPDRDPGSAGIATLNAKLWIEWQPDFGKPPPADTAGGAFDMLVGVNNLKRFLMIDHDFEFHIEVFLDGRRVGALDIPADTERVRVGRFPLGELAGKHHVKLRWTNDHYVKGEFDANIRYASLRFVERDLKAPIRQGE